MFRCEICGKEHKTIGERAKCELECIKKQEIEAENKKKAELKAKKEGRLKEIQDKYNELIKLIKSYDKDYNGTLGVGNIPQNYFVRVKPEACNWADVLKKFDWSDFFNNLLEDKFENR